MAKSRDSDATEVKMALSTWIKKWLAALGSKLVDLPNSEGETRRLEAVGGGLSPVTKADLIRVSLQAQGKLESPRLEQVITALDQISNLLDSNSGTDNNAIRIALSEIEQELHHKRWLPLMPILFFWLPIAVVVFAWLTPSVLEGNASGAKILGIDSQLFWGAVTLGIGGSFVRVLNRAVRSEYYSLHAPMLLAVGLLRPLAGAVMGIFIVAVFATGLISVPLADPSDPIFGDLPRGHAIIFSFAFVAGLIDDLVLNIAARLTQIVSPR